MKGRIFWGAIFIAFGVLLMLDQVGILPGSAYSYLWPMILISLGLIVLYNAMHRRSVHVLNEARFPKQEDGSESADYQPAQNQVDSTFKAPLAP